MKHNGTMRWTGPFRSSEGTGYDVRELAKRSVTAFMVVILIQPPTAVAADRTEIATAALEFGGSVGKLLWVAVKDQSAVNQSEANRYVKLASQIKEQIEVGRASSILVQTNFNVVGTTLAYAAAVEPEPLSKAVSGVAAWGAKKTGDVIGQMVIDQSQTQARAILAQGLQNSGLSETQLKTMNADELRTKVADLKVGGQTLRETLKDDSDSLSMLQAHAVDIATNIGVEALARSEGTKSDVKAIRQDLAKTKKDMVELQEQVKSHLETMIDRVGGLEETTRVANEKLEKLKDGVQGQSKIIRTLAQISYSGWTTAQKVQAVEGGLFPNLTQTQQTALLESLKADHAREEAVADVQRAARDFGNLAGIAKNIGLPKDVVTGLQGAQKVATGIAQFATGDVLGAVASLTSLVGLGAPDAAAERHAAMMKYLDQKFAEVNRKLDAIIDLQVQTLKAVAALAEDQRKFRIEVLGQLDRIENDVLRTEKLSQAILLSQWEKCHALINGTSLNGQFEIPTREVLVGVIGNPNIGEYAGNCYEKMVEFLDARVKPANWAGQIIDGGSFPNDAIASEPELLKSWVEFESEHLNAYKSAREFVLAMLPDAGGAPAGYVARFSQPVVDSYFADQLRSVFAKPGVQERFGSFKCDQEDVLSPGLKGLLCFGIVDGAASAPRSSRWRALLDAPLIGPYSTGLIDTGIVLAKIADFARKDEKGAFVFVKPSAIEDFWRDAATPQLENALEQRKGSALLEKLRWLTEAKVLQESITYGDYTAQLAERALYDPATRALNTDPKVGTKSLKQRALAAMRSNPVLARNVVLLGMRHAVADWLEGSERAEELKYFEMYYALALSDFGGAQACDGFTFPSLPAAHRWKLFQMLQNWHFEYVVTSEEKLKDGALSKCMTAFEPDPRLGPSQSPARGSGVAVVVDDFYVLAPSPLSLSSGRLEVSESLQLALAYRDRLSQEIIDRSIAATVQVVAGSGQDSKAIAARTAFGLLNEGLDWQTRRKTQ